MNFAILAKFLDLVNLATKIRVVGCFWGNSDPFWTCHSYMDPKSDEKVFNVGHRCPTLNTFPTWDF